MMSQQAEIIATYREARLPCPSDHPIFFIICSAMDGALAGGGVSKFGGGMLLETRGTPEADRAVGSSLS